MKRNIIISFLSTAAIALVFSTAAFPQTQGSGDNAIETKLAKEIGSLPYYGLFDYIGFNVKGGTVTLVGKVHSLGTSSSAERVAKRVPGVIEVVNKIEDLPPSSMDNAIRRSLVRRINQTPGLFPYLTGPNPSVRLIVDRGRITLEGYVADKGTSNLMYLVARQVPGTFDVTNNLIVTKNEG